MWVVLKIYHVTTLSKYHKIYTITGQDRPLKLQKFESLRICRQSADECGNIVSPTRQPPLPLGDTFGTHFCYRRRPERLNQYRISTAPSEIETATFMLAAQCLNQLHQNAPLLNIIVIDKCRRTISESQM
jgi:hypothetical protein